VIAEVALAYRAAGADFITVHEMGGSPGFLGPPAFNQFVLPRLQRLFAALPAPRVLSVCGDTNASMAALAQAGADALSVDQTNDLARSRAALGPEALLFGNLDPIGTLALGDEDGVRRAAEAAIAAGADAVWPGCDLWPEVPAANLRAMVEAAGSPPARGGYE
jgi:[methyl-Co(III) methanol-specific corrinoid protein]:coenzyme M methyltransferase